MRRYRVSNVEAFRQWENDECADTDALIADILGHGQESEAMAKGTAFHKALELAIEGQEFDSIERNGYVFTFAGDFSLPLTPIRELRASKTYIVDGEPIVISGQVDGMDGRLIIDHKTTGRFDPDRYLFGYQWRLYLEIFEANHFRWNVFEMRDRDDGAYEVFALHTLEEFRYHGMDDDCRRLVERFAHFVRDRVEVTA